MRYIITHKNCNDGMASALAAWLVFKDDQTKYVFCDYKDPVPEIPDATEIFILDFSFKRPILLDMFNKVNGKIKVLDHHKSAKKELEGLDFCTFNMDKCGAVLSWEYFHPTKEIPVFFKYVQDYDLFTKKLFGINESNAYINSFQRNIEQFNKLLDEYECNNAGVLVQGGVILRYHQRDVEKCCEDARFHIWDGVPCMIVNAQGYMASDVGEKLLEDNKNIEFVCIYYDKDGCRSYSLRSRGETREIGGYDVSALANKYGGGGHRSAANFVIKTTVPFIL